MTADTIQIGDRVVADDRPTDPGTVTMLDRPLIFVETDSGFRLVRTAEHLAPEPEPCYLCETPAVTTGFVVVGAPYVGIEGRRPLCQEHTDEALYEGEPA